MYRNKILTVANTMGLWLSDKILDRARNLSEKSHKVKVAPQKSVRSVFILRI